MSFETSVGASDADSITVMGRDLAGDLLGKTTFTELTFLLVRRRAPSPAETRMLDAVGYCRVRRLGQTRAAHGGEVRQHRAEHAPARWGAPAGNRRMAEEVHEPLLASLRGRRRHRSRYPEPESCRVQ